MPHANRTGTSLKYIGRNGDTETIYTLDRKATAETVNHNHQGATDIVPQDVLDHARPIADDQYFAAPVFGPDGMLLALRYAHGPTIRIDCHVEFWGSSAIQVDLVVTQHDPLVQHLRDEGYISERTPVFPHVSVKDVKGKHVLGVLPVAMAAHCASYSEIPMKLTQDDRAALRQGDLPIERVRAACSPPVRYIVSRA